MQVVENLRSVRRDPHIIAASLTANILGLAVPIGMIQIYDRVIPNAAFATLTALAIGVFAALLADMALRIARGQLMSLAGEKFEIAAYQRVMSHLLNEDTGRVNSDSPGQLMNKTMAVERLRGFHTGESAAALLDLPFVFIFLALIALISPILAGTVLMLITVAFIAIHMMRRRIITLSIDRQNNDDRRQSFLIETLKGVEVVKSLGMEDFMMRRYERLMGTAAPVSAALARLIQTTQGVTGAIGLLAPLVTASVGAALVLNDRMSMGGLAAVVLLTGRIVQPVLRIEALLVGEEDTARARDDLTDIIKRPIRPTGAETLEQVDTLSLRDIVWRPAEDKPLIFNGLSLELERGDCVALVGQEGAGRSSLLRLIAGDVVVQEGEMSINGKPCSQFRIEDRQERIRLLTRQNVLLDGTILDNMTAFRPDRYLESALDLATELGLDGFVAQHRDGLNHIVGPSGPSRLPTSVNDTTLLIAGLVTRPDVILFEEANAGLDHEADKKLLAWMKAQKKDAIIIMITHRPSYMRLANRTLRLSGGKLSRSSSLPTLSLSSDGIRVA